LRRKGAIHQHQPSHALDRTCLEDSFRALQGGCIGRCRERQHFPHQDAQVGVFPVLDPPVRQAGAFIGFECLPPDFGDLALARQPRARGSEGVAERVSGGIGLCQNNIHCDCTGPQAASSNRA
jgi:hypothetical protein